MTNLKDNIWIEGFDRFENMIDFKDSIRYINEPNPIIYQGKTAEVPEGLAKMCVLNWRTDGLYNNYKIESQYEEYIFKSAVQSIQSACDKPYCIIYKK